MPFARLSLSREGFPLEVRLCAFNPLIPHCELDSSIPAALFEWELINTTDAPVEAALACSLRNPSPKARNTGFRCEGGAGLFLGSEVQRDTPQYSDMTVLCDGADTDIQEYWYRGRWMDGVTTFWKNFSTMKRLPERSYPDAGSADHRE